jgi:1-deoxy-D-xylulose-5-phosphate reductoisomerase
VGFAGLRVTLAALAAGRRLALANKESLIAGGPVVRSVLGRPGAGHIVPVDSEHCAVHQCLAANASGDPARVARIVLTASGGPFRGRSRAELADVTIDDALAHPTWSMGPKITVDSATLANKGLELIEAHYLFGLGYGRIEVVVHPSSVVHALVRLRDGAALAHLGYPDMRVPISYALTYPERASTPVSALDFRAGLTLEFESPDLERFPLLRLAREAGERGGTYPCAFNAANEIAVSAFLDRRIGFNEIARLVEGALSEVDGSPARDLDELTEADAGARRAAQGRLAAA